MMVHMYVPSVMMVSPRAWMLLKALSGVFFM